MTTETEPKKVSKTLLKTADRYLARMRKGEADRIDEEDFDYAFNAQIDSLRSLARRVAVEAERTKLAGKA